MELARPPHRADHVGSLLRPAALRAAHEAALAGRFPREELRVLQERAIRDAIAMQEASGLHSITDGEFRRTSFHADFIGKLDGARSAGSNAPGSGGQVATEVWGSAR